jgi:SPOR domain
MTLSETSVQGVDLDDLERQMRDVIPKTSDDRLAEIARQIGRSLGGPPGGRERAASVTPQPRVSAGSLDEDKALAEVGSPQGSKVPVDQSLHDDNLARIPDAPDAVLSSRALKKRSPLSWRALALAALLLVVAGGVGLAVVMRAGPTDGSRSEAPVIKADDEPVQQVQVAADIHTPSQPALGTAVSSANPDQPIDSVAATNPAPPPTAVTPVGPAMPTAAAEASVSDPPKPAAESSMIGTPHRASTVSIKPDGTIMAMGTPEAAPLPPSKPRSLASTDPTASVRAKPSDARANAAGASSFSIQLASSHSKSDAVATLSRLKKQFPDVLGGGSIRQADGGGTGVLYRVQVGSLSRDAADKACSRLKASGENCIVVRT